MVLSYFVAAALLSRKAGCRVARAMRSGRWPRSSILPSVQFSPGSVRQEIDISNLSEVESVARGRRDMDWKARMGAHVKIDFEKVRFSSYFTSFSFFRLFSFCLGALLLFLPQLELHQDEPPSTKLSLKRHELGMCYSKRIDHRRRTCRQTRTSCREV